MTISPTTNLVDIDLIPASSGPPYELFKQWREEDPVHWNPPPQEGAYTCPTEGRSMRQGFWVLTRYADVAEVSRDQEVFSSYVGGPIIWDLEPPQLQQQQSGLMGLPDDIHKKVKRLVVPHFGPREMKALEPQVAKVAEEIIDRIAGDGGCEFVFDIASRLPVYTFCTMMGVKPEDRDYIMELGNLLADTESDRGTAVDARGKLFAYATQITQEKRRQPDGSLMSAYVNSEVDGERLSDEQIQMFFVVMSIAGHETTRSTAVHFIRLMNEHPEQYALLRSDIDAHLDNALDEVLRISPPVIQFRRTATRDVELGGKAIKAGDKVYISYPAANRDPAVFDDPDRFDITRPNAKRHLSFGIGPHICLGERIARMQLRYLIRQIVQRLPDIRPSAPMTFLPSIWFNAVIDMPVTFTPESAR